MKNQSKLSIMLTRDSVAAGDDYDAPHEKKITILPFTDPVSLARESATNYLPNVAGVGHSWVCVLNNVEIAEIKTNTILPLINEAIFNENNHIHFVYKSAIF